MSNNNQQEKNGLNQERCLKKRWFTRFFSNKETVRETIEDLIEERKEEVQLSAHERLLLGNILKLKDLRAVDVMTQRADIDAIEVDATVDSLIEKMTEKSHSRMPVFKKTLDDIVGIAHVKDVVGVLKGQKNKAIVDIMNPDVIFISPSMKILDLLRDMQAKKTHMVMVVDEYGGIDGLITIEILVEQIVGEIEDEHDNETPPDLIWHSNGTLEADARAQIEDFEKIAGQILTEDEKEENIDTIGGLVFHIAGRMPVRGEIVRHSSGVRFWIMEADARQIKRLMVSNFHKQPLTPKNKKVEKDSSNTEDNKKILDTEKK